MPSLDNRVALVTGAGRGIGRAIAAGLSAAGAMVIATDIDGGAAEQAAAEFAPQGGGMGFALDVTDLDACERLATTLREKAGPVSILVNNAGVIFPGRIDEAGAAENWARTLAINAGGAFNMCRSFAEQLRSTHGAVINLASIRSFVAAGNAAAYAASKGAVMQFTKALAVEWGGDGVRVNAIAPGFVETGLVPASEKTPQRDAAILARTPLTRIGDPTDVVGAAVFLASDTARYVTGAILPVDGGYLAG